MDYRVHITNEQGAGIPGSIHLYDANGAPITVVDIPESGGVVPGDLVANTATFHIDSPGYIGYDVLQLADLSSFALVKESNHLVLYVMVALLGAAIAGKLLKL